MSMVQFSSGALGTLASSSSRTFPLSHRDTPPHRRVCRSLFGPVDHEELNRELKAKLREIAERDQRRWNFNFSAEVPLLGEYEWEETPGETSPAFYQECVRVGKSMTVEMIERSVLGQNHTEGETVKCGQHSVHPHLTQKKSSDLGSTKLPCKTSQRKRPAPVTTTLITDFYVKRRSTVGVKQRKISTKSFSSVTEEQTPRKRIR